MMKVDPPVGRPGARGAQERRERVARIRVRARVVGSDPTRSPDPEEP